MHHAIRTFMATLLASALLLTSAACGDKAEPSATKDSPKGVITVAASINQWGSLASEIGGSDADLLRSDHLEQGGNRSDERRGLRRLGHQGTGP